MKWINHKLLGWIPIIYKILEQFPTNRVEKSTKISREEEKKMFVHMTMFPPPMCLLWIDIDLKILDMISWESSTSNSEHIQLVHHPPREPQKQ